jgi:hypothetical protein
MATRISDAALLAQIPAARAAERSARRAGHRARSVRYDGRHARIVLELTNDVVFAFPVRAIASLRRATPQALRRVTLSPSGSVVHWAALDVDLSVAGLLLAAIDPAERTRALASLAGRATSAAKAEAARANGAKGGRPRKAAAAPTSRRSKAA